MINSLTLSASSPLPELGLARPTSFPSPGISDTHAPSGFADVLADYVSSATKTLKTAEAAATAGIEGKIPLQAMVDQILTAERTLQTTVAIRDKIVSSYLEISRMQV